MSVGSSIKLLAVKLYTLNCESRLNLIFQIFKSRHSIQQECTELRQSDYFNKLFPTLKSISAFQTSGISDLKNLMFGFNRKIKEERKEKSNMKNQLHHFFSFLWHYKIRNFIATLSDYLGFEISHSRLFTVFLRI